MGGYLYVRVCVRASVQKPSVFVFFSRRRTLAQRRLECSSAALGLFHFICSVMSLVTAVRGREIGLGSSKLSHREGGKAAKEGGRGEEKNIQANKVEHF